jgi:hypothetical protein
MGETKSGVIMDGLGHPNPFEKMVIYASDSLSTALR